MKKLFLIVAVAGILSACEKNMENTSMGDLIVGNWSRMISADTTHLLQKSDTMPGDDYGIAFLKDGLLKENKNSGWCGTPPISYGEVEGTWELFDDSTLVIESSYWGGDMSMTWKILEINNADMSYYILDYFYEDFQ